MAAKLSWALVLDGSIDSFIHLLGIVVFFLITKILRLLSIFTVKLIEQLRKFTIKFNHHLVAVDVSEGIYF